MSIWEHLKSGLSKTRGKLMSQLGQLLTVGDIDESFYEELEEILISADIGVAATTEIISSLKDRVRQERLKEKEQVKELIKDIIKEILTAAHHKVATLDQEPPFVYLILGVNGVGKTTSIAKLAYYFMNQGKNVLLAAGDTFRAAAIEQLEKWSALLKTDIIKHQLGADPSAVIYDGIKASIARDVDILLCDTAGRLHTKTNLMDEMKKIYRVASRALKGAPHEVLLVIDATTGQNGLLQARQFNQAVPLSGIILSKLDGTARGGIAIAICKELGIPIRYVGLGENLKDLSAFDPDKFAEALFS